MVDVAALWKYMSDLYATTILDKRTAPEMALAAAGLGIFKLAPGFATDYTTTLGKRIYVPFTPGVADDRWSLVGQAAVCAHEHQHVVQLNQDGFKYLWGYATSTAKRAAYEIEAYRATLEMQWYLLGAIADPDTIADDLVSYGCSAADVQTARAALEAYADVVRTGIVVTQAAQRAIAFLRPE